MKSYVILSFFVGIIFIVIGYINSIQKTPPPIVEYRYIPRTFEEEQENPVQVSKLFSNMFNQPDPWIASTSLGILKQNVFQINKHFISQS